MVEISCNGGIPETRSLYRALQNQAAFLIIHIYVDQVESGDGEIRPSIVVEIAAVTPLRPPPFGSV